MFAPWSRMTSDFFAVFFGFVLRTSFVPATGVPAPGGKVVVVVLLVVLPFRVVVVVAEHGGEKQPTSPALLVGVGGARAKSVWLSAGVSKIRVRLMEPLLALSEVAVPAKLGFAATCGGFTR